MTPPRSFFKASAWAAMPLVLWALHFSFAYMAVVIGCHAGWQRAATGGMSLLHGVLLSGSAAAIIAAAALLYLSCRQAGTAHRSLLAQVRVAAALMSLLGIVWSSVPGLFLPACRLS